MRRQFAKFNYSVPIIILTAHTHQVHCYQCFGEDGKLDSNCYNTEAGCYGRNVMHTVYTYNETEF